MTARSILSGDPRYDSEGSFRATGSYQHYQEDDQNFAFHYFGPSEGNPLGPLAVPIFGGQTVFQAGGTITTSTLIGKPSIRVTETALLSLGDVAGFQTIKSLTSFRSWIDSCGDLDSTGVIFWPKQLCRASECRSQNSLQLLW